MAEIPIFSPLVTHVPEVGKTSKFFWYILRWTRHHTKIFKFLGQKGSEICKVKNRDFEIFSYILHPISRYPDSGPGKGPENNSSPEKNPSPFKYKPHKIDPHINYRSFKVSINCNAYTH